MSVQRLNTLPQFGIHTPNSKDLISNLEMVQRRAARFVLADYKQQSSLAQMLLHLHWQSLQERRTHNKAIMLYKIINNLVAIPPAPPYLYHSSDLTRGHHIQLRQHHCTILSYQHSFFPSVVCIWNGLPATVVSAPSLKTFRSSLKPLTLQLSFPQGDFYLHR